jgi:predicted amidophosphoribosyltransferase
MSGIHLDETILSLSEGGKVEPQEYKLKTIICTRCSEKISPGLNYCGKCALPVNLSEEYLQERNIQKENMELREEIRSVREYMNRQFSQIMTLIKTNPVLVNVKPEALLTKEIQPLT